MHYSKETTFNDIPVIGPDGVRYPSRSACARAYNIPPNNFQSRLRHGWDLEKALTTPVKRQGVTGPDGKKYKTLRSLLFDYGVQYNRYTYLNRVLGIPLEEILKMESPKLAGKKE